MLREDAIYLGLGGAGGRLVDTILASDDRFMGYFINTSITDLQSLYHFNHLTKNYFCISQQNGVGRDRNIGKAYAEQQCVSIINKIFNYQQETIYLVFSLSGGSGSSIASAILNQVSKLRELDAFDKVINAICILPDLNSPDVLLRNAIETWNEIISSKAINSLIVIDNNVNLSALNQNDKEIKINETFVKMFDSIFDIPNVNGINFDGGNLSNVLNDKGCLYIYDIPSNCGSIEVALNKAESNSVLAKMFKTSKNTVENVDGSTSISCGYVGISLTDELYDSNYILKNYSSKKETYIGENEDKNLLLISGCLPPFHAIQVIETELLDREKNSASNDDDEDIFSSFVTKSTIPTQSKTQPVNNKKQKANFANKRVLKKSLFSDL